jgi:cell division protease FtsH
MDDPTLISRQQLFARIVGGLGGRAAEEVIFGEPEVTTGAAGDLQQITGLAKQVYFPLHCNFVNGNVNVCKEFCWSSQTILHFMTKNQTMLQNHMVEPVIIDSNL